MPIPIYKKSDVNLNVDENQNSCIIDENLFSGVSQSDFIK